MGIVLDFISGKNSCVLLFLSSLSQSKRDKKTNTPKERQQIYWCALVCVLLYLLLLNVFALYSFILYVFINVMLYI